MSKGTLKERTAKGLFWGGISSGLQQIFQLVFGVIMLRLLTPEEYGITGSLFIFQAIAWVLLEGGIGTAIVNKKNATLGDYSALWMFSVLVSFLLYCILYFAAPFIASFFKEPALINVSRIYFLSILIAGLSVAQSTYLFKELKNKERAIIDFFSLLVSATIGIILAYKGFSYWALVIQNVVNQSLCAILRWVFVPWKPLIRINFKPLIGMFSFSLKLFASNIFNAVFTNIFSILLGRFYDMKQVGLYTQGYKWSSMGSSFINGMMVSVALPTLAKVNDDKGRQKHIFRKLLRFGAFFSFPLILGLAFVGEEFLLMIGKGETWLPATPFLQLFCIWFAFHYIWILYTNTLLTHGKSDIYLLGIIVVGVLQLSVIAIMFPYGIFHMIIAYIIVNFIGLLFWHYFTNKIIGLKLLHVIKDISPYLIITLISITISWLITNQIESILFRFIAKIIITAVIYISIIWFSNSVIIKECYHFIRNRSI